jgi:hypothetical protein
MKAPARKCTAFCRPGMRARSPAQPDGCASAASIGAHGRSSAAALRPPRRPMVWNTFLAAARNGSATRSEVHQMIAARRAQSQAARQQIGIATATAAAAAWMACDGIHAASLPAAAARHRTVIQGIARRCKCNALEPVERSTSQRRRPNGLIRGAGRPRATPDVWLPRHARPCAAQHPATVCVRVRHRMLLLWRAPPVDFH